MIIISHDLVVIVMSVTKVHLSQDISRQFHHNINLYEIFERCADGSEIMINYKLYHTLNNWNNSSILSSLKFEERIQVGFDPLTFCCLPV